MGEDRLGNARGKGREKRAEKKTDELSALAES